MLIKVSLSLRRRQPLALLALLAVLSPGISFAQSADTAGTLPEDYYPGLKSILDVALKQSPQMLARNIDLAQSEANRYMADANLWPTLSGYSAYSTLWQQATNNGEKGDVSRSNGLNYSVAVSQPIFQWGVYKYQSDIGKLAQQIVNRQYADAWRMLAMSVRAQYQIGRAHV